MTTEDQYIAQLQKMSENAQKWRAAHPTAEVLVQFNFPPKVGVIGTISDAIDAGAVSTNDNGLALVKALWPWDVKSEPTVFMVRLALEDQ